MIKRLVILFGTVFLIFLGAVLLLRGFRVPITAITHEELPLTEYELLTGEEEPRELTKEILLSSPLVIFDRGSATPFTPKSVIDETNRQRVAAGLIPLAENLELNKAAELKVQDLFERQYFDHISPTGEGPDSLAREAGYEYVSIGENLALGSFGDEEALVDAWMKSPGHRANILRPQFQEIGLAVGRGNFNGRQVLIAVQEFGKPLFSCPSVSVKLKDTINAEKGELATLAATLEVIRKDIDSARGNDAARYEDKVNLYNSEVARYNKLVASIREKTTEYNNQVRTFNACLKSSV